MECSNGALIDSDLWAWNLLSEAFFFNIKLSGHLPSLILRACY